MCLTAPACFAAVGPVGPLGPLGTFSSIARYAFGIFSGTGPPVSTAAPPGFHPRTAFFVTFGPLAPLTPEGTGLLGTVLLFVRVTRAIGTWFPRGTLAIA